MALTFNGSTSKLVWAGQIASAFPVTLFCWLKPTSAGVSQMVCGAGDTGGTSEFDIYADGNGTSKVRAYLNNAAGSGSNSIESTTAVQTSWQPAMAVFTDGTSADIYYAAGAKVTTSQGNTPTWANLNRFVVGQRGISDTLSFAGDIAEIALWSTALTQTNFNSLAAGALPESVASGSLIESWSLLMQAATQVGTVSRTLTATSTSQAGSHPITRSAGGGANQGLPIDMGRF